MHLQEPRLLGSSLEGELFGRLGEARVPWRFVVFVCCFLFFFYEWLPQSMKSLLQEPLLLVRLPSKITQMAPSRSTVASKKKPSRAKEVAERRLVTRMLKWILVLHSFHFYGSFLLFGQSERVVSACCVLHNISIALGNSYRARLGRRLARIPIPIVSPQDMRLHLTNLL